MQHPARVVACSEDMVSVEPLDRTGCGACSAGDACGVGAVQRWLASRSETMDLATHSRPAVGSEVIIEIDDNALLAGAFLVYLLPLLGLVLGGVIGRGLGFSDGVATITALSIATLTLFSVRRVLRRPGFAARLRPRMKQED